MDDVHSALILAFNSLNGIIIFMGVNHGGRGGRVPPRIWSAGDASANRPPPEFVMFQNMKHQLLTYNAV